MGLGPEVFGLLQERFGSIVCSLGGLTVRCQFEILLV